MGLGVPQAVEFYLDLKEILEETDIDLEMLFLMICNTIKRIGKYLRRR